jgi:tetratricopeptide (TPR) repeat protein
MLLYAKAVALAALKRFDEAKEHQQLFWDAIDRFSDDHNIGNNTAKTVLAVGREMIAGELHYHQGQHDLAFTHLRKAIELNDALNYTEPWDWMHPPRHALGALMLEQGQPEEAIKYFQQDLGLATNLPRCCQHPGNVWALHGYYQCLQKLGRSEEADALQPQLDKAMKLTDVEIQAACCCANMN